MKETNRELGIKWFTFYTKVRPWLTCLSSLSIIRDFFEYADVYFDYWWMVLYFLASLAQPVLAIMVFAKSKGNYEDFVGFIGKPLILETTYIAYQAGVQAYAQSFEIGPAIIIVVSIFVAGYFLWYRLNMRYFKKRIKKEGP